jgi:peptidoglycan/xylan/chitin deacetylase (PgdA/CDA1 family)
MGEQDVVSLGSEFEVGAHTLSHVVLTRTDANVARNEIEESKSWLELLLGKECEVFCFPQGKFDSEHLGMVRDAGFKGARTVELMSSRIPAADSGLVVLPTTVQAMDHHYTAYLRNFAKRRSITGLWQFARAGMPQDWTRLARIQFDRMLANGSGVFHLWGHSWELEEYQQWDRLDSFLAYIAGHQGEIKTLSNSELCRPRVKVTG